MSRPSKILNCSWTLVILNAIIVSIIYLVELIYLIKLAPTMQEPSFNKSRVMKMNITRNKNNFIPRIIHQTYSDLQIPKTYEKYVASIANHLCINHTFNTSIYSDPVDFQYRVRNYQNRLCYNYVFWNDKSIMQLVNDRFPQLEQLFKSYSRLERSDAVRYLILHEFGGIYSDMDNEFIRPIDAAVEWGVASLFAHLPYVRQWPSLHLHLECTLMMSVPRHPFLRLLIDSLNASRSAENVWFRTGPEFLTRLYREYLSLDPNRTSDCRNNPRSRPDCVHVPLPARIFYPNIYAAFANIATMNCNHFLRFGSNNVSETICYFIVFCCIYEYS